MSLQSCNMRSSSSSFESKLSELEKLAFWSATKISGCKRLLLIDLAAESSSARMTPRAWPLQSDFSWHVVKISFWTPLPSLLHLLPANLLFLCLAHLSRVFIPRASGLLGSCSHCILCPGKLSHCCDFLELPFLPFKKLPRSAFLIKPTNRRPSQSSQLIACSQV